MSNERRDEPAMVHPDAATREEGAALRVAVLRATAGLDIDLEPQSLLVALERLAADDSTVHGAVHGADAGR